MATTPGITRAAVKSIDLILACASSLRRNATCNKPAICLSSTYRPWPVKSLGSSVRLTIYDMCKMFAQDLEISEVFLLEKSGGKSGEYVRKAEG